MKEVKDKAIQVVTMPGSDSVHPCVYILKESGRLFCLVIRDNDINWNEIPVPE